MMRAPSGLRLVPWLCRASAALVIATSVADSASWPKVQAQAQDQQPRVFRGGVDLIQVDTYPMRDGRAVEGLTAEDFQVFEDGKPQQIQSVEFVHAEGNTPIGDRRDPSSQEEGNALAANARGRAFVIYLDTYHVSLDGSSRTRGPLVGFLGRMLAPADVFAVTAPQLRPRDLVFVRSTTTLEREINKIWIWGVQPVGMQAYTLEPEEQALARCYGWLGHDRYLELTIKRRREDLVLRHLEGLMSYLGAVREARKTLVLLTRGWQLYTPDQASLQAIVRIPGSSAGCDGEIQRLFTLDDDQRFRRLLEDANRNNVAFYPVNPAGLEPVDSMMNDPGLAAQELGLRENSFKTLAENTNGVWGLRNDLGANLRAVSDDVSSYYLVSYYSSNASLDGKYRRIEVKVRQPGVKVRARPGYFAASNAASTAAGFAPARSATAPVSNALGALARLDTSADFRMYSTVSPADLILVAELSSAKSDAPAWSQGGDVTVDVTDSAGAKLAPVAAHIESGARSALVRIPRGTSAGPWRATVRLRAANETLEEVAMIQSADAGASVFGPPLIYRAPTPARAPFRPVAEFQFRRTERLRVEWPLATEGAAPGARLLDRLGQPLPISVTLTERTTDGQRVVGTDVSLAPLSPGDYVIEISAGDATAGDRSLIAFRIVR